MIRITLNGIHFGLTQEQFDRLNKEVRTWHPLKESLVAKRWTYVEDPKAKPVEMSLTQTVEFVNLDEETE